MMKRRNKEADGKERLRDMWRMKWTERKNGQEHVWCVYIRVLVQSAKAGECREKGKWYIS